MKLPHLAKLVLSNLFVFIALLLLIDNLIFFFPEYLPKGTINFISHESQMKYYLKHPKKSIFEFDDYIYYFKPSSTHELWVDDKSIDVYSDQFGYTNPNNYLDKERIEVLLIGDSMTESAVFSKNMRDNFNGKVYSIGMGGQGLFHWKYQYQRFKNVYPNFQNPKIIVLNYFEGNDIPDSYRALKYLKAGYKSSLYYPMNPINDRFEILNRNISFFHEIYSIMKNILHVVSPEFKIKLKQLLWDNSLLKTDAGNVTADYPLLHYSDSCNIRIEPTEDPKLNTFSEDINTEIVDLINEMLNLVNKEETKVFFSYVPNISTIYNEKLTDHPNLSDSARLQVKSSLNFKNYFSDKNILYIDLTPQLIEIAKSKPLHPCNGSDTHFSKYGYGIYSKLLSDNIKEIMGDSY